MKKLLLLTVFGLALAGCYHDKSLVTGDSKNAVEYMDENGNVDDDKFEESQAVSQDDSMGTIEAELENTVILDEDFSDL